ncbi:MAG: hypothetical protein DMF76_03095 [Acidobacteria bacterium]|nr:MAG: hypothetical protein DMF76_03095 [Acidobacteriota bacterium]
MKKLTIILCLALIASALGVSGFAKSLPISSINRPQDSNVYTHKDAGVQFEVPKGWKAKPDGEVITVSSGDESVQVVFWVPDEDTFDAAVKELDKELSKTIKNVKTTSKSKEDKHNGMAHFEEAGTGDVNGVTIAWSVDVLGAKKPLIILTFAAPDLLEKQAAEYMKLVGSIKKIE